MPKAEAAARKALELDDALADAHASLAGVLYRYHWRWNEAEQEFKRALAIDPNYAEGHRARAIFLLVLRRNDDALNAARRARQLSPLSPIINVELAYALTRARRFDEAIEQLRRAQEIAPDYPRIRATLALTYLHMGDPARALETLDGFVAPRSRGPWFGYLCAIQGRRQEARKVRTDLEARARSGYVSPQEFAIVHLGLGEEEQALSLLEKAYEERAFSLLSFAGPLADILLDNPRFQHLLRRMGLAGQPGYAPRVSGKR
jgi:serine/threonine-protein kinase